MVKKLKYLIVLVTLVITGAAFTFVYKGGPTAVKTVVIDPGHGGKDPGCLGASHKEKEVALAVALKLGKYIEDNFKDVKVIYTRTTDVFVQLEERAQIANRAKADLFISIHCNAAGRPVMIKDPKTGKNRPKKYKNKKGKYVIVEEPNPVPFGTETYVMGLKNEEGKMKVATRENSAIFYEDDYEKKYGGFDPESEESYIIMSNYTSAYVIQSANLALKIQEEYTKKAGRVDKGVHRQSIWVLWRTSMPSVLTEIGYLTNPLEETFLGSEKGQEYLAKAIFRGFRKYKDELEGNKREYNDEFENQTPLENENLKVRKGNSGSKETEEEEPEVEEKEEIQESDKAVVAETKKQTTDQKNSTTAAAVEKTAATVKEAEKTPPVHTNPEVKNKPVDKSGTTLPQKDTGTSANSVAEKFRKESAEEAVSKGEDSVKSELKTSVSENKSNAISDEIVFKVQFATSQVKLDLKQEKYAAIQEGDFYKVNSALKYTSGKFRSIKEATSHQNYLREKGFKDCFVVAFRNGERMDVLQARKLSEQ